MKVLIVHNAYQSHQVGGEDIVVKREIAGLQESLGHDNVFEYIVSNDDIQFSKLAVNIWGDKTHYKQIFALVQKNNIDIVHVHNFFPLLTTAVFKAAKAAGAKVIHTLHNFRWWCSSGILYRNDIGNCEKCIDKKFGFPGVIHGCYRNSHIQSLVANLAFTWYRQQFDANDIDMYFVLSHFQQEKLKSKIPFQKLQLKPNWIDEPKQVYLSEEKKDYVFVGRLEPAKGIDVLLSTWKKLPKSFHLQIIGTDDDGKYLKQYACENISFLGKLTREEVLAHIGKAKYLLQTSLSYETFGLTIVEALSFGTPVIGFNIGTRSEFIQTGKNGFLCEKENLEATLLQSYDFSDYKTLSQNAFESAKPFYSQTVLPHQISIYKKIIENDALSSSPLAGEGWGEGEGGLAHE
ncbi:MAG: glycosyltransferase family 4 protein [Gammaproteobacteria bacterium]|jgi:glycosyltransferase involved in cell wall biosynthesis|nr:glycosyltransferase family 4 protein [Gammaproteobacteria bacterium]